MEFLFSVFSVFSVFSIVVSMFVGFEISIVDI